MSDQQFVWIAERVWSSYQADEFLGVYESMDLAKIACHNSHITNPHGPYRHAQPRPVFAIKWDVDADDYDEGDSYGKTWSTGEVGGYEYRVARHEVVSLL